MEFVPCFRQNLPEEIPLGESWRAELRTSKKGPGNPPLLPYDSISMCKKPSCGSEYYIIQIIHYTGCKLSPVNSPLSCQMPVSLYCLFVSLFCACFVQIVFWLFYLLFVFVCVFMSCELSVTPCCCPHFLGNELRDTEIICKYYIHTRETNSGSTQGSKRYSYASVLKYALTEMLNYYHHISRVHLLPLHPLKVVCGTPGNEWLINWTYDNCIYLSTQIMDAGAIERQHRQTLRINNSWRTTECRMTRTRLGGVKWRRRKCCEVRSLEWTSHLQPKFKD